MYMVYIWLAVIAAGLLLEAVEAGTLVTIWFSVGAVVPLVMSFFDVSGVWYIILQVIIFGITTILCLIFLRRIARKTLLKNSKGKTNMDLFVGKVVKISRIDGEIEYIKLNGVEYRAITEDSQSFTIGEKVKILKVSGNKIVVEKLGEDK